MRPPGAGIANENFLNSDRYLGKYKIATADELQARVDSYFNKCDENRTIKYTAQGVPYEILDPKPYTWTGLALAVGLSGRSALLKYWHRDEFYPVLLEARLKVQEQWESCLHRLGNNGGAMYNLSNNTLNDEQYVNKTIVDQNLGGQPGNPLEIKQSVDDLPEDVLERMKELLDAHTKSGGD
jgi:hypothetical protein